MMKLALSIALCMAVPMRCIAQDSLPPFPVFRSQSIDDRIGNVCYALTVADVDGDNKQDIVAVSENRVLWYQNPRWQPRVIIADQTPKDNVCIAPYDVDGDGKIDFALGAGWTGANTGTIHWLRRNESLDERWQVHAIGQERFLHRMRWADVLGKGKPQLVVSPLTASQGAGVRLMAFEIPANPVSERWPETVLNSELNRMHNHWHVDWNADGLIDTITASQEGIHLIQLLQGNWNKAKLGTGAVAGQAAQSGAGEIKVGRLRNGKRFIATVEPMHGTMLAVYTEPQELGALWQRQIVDEGFVRGHGLWLSDMDGDGADEIVFGHSDTPRVPGVNVYRNLDNGGIKWEKHVVDAGGVATEDLIVADFDGDGRPEIVAGGRSTHNVVLYWNRKP